MDNSDTLSNSSSAATNAFLDELESIKGILDDHQNEIQTDVPLLNDVVSGEAEIPQFSLQAVSADDIPTLQVADDNTEPFAFPDDYSEGRPSSEQSTVHAGNLSAGNVIHSAEYREEQQEFFPSVDSDIHPADSVSDQNDDFDLELLIQEVVDDVIPTLENELRKRLSLCSPELIKRLAERIN